MTDYLAVPFFYRIFAAVCANVKHTDNYYNNIINNKMLMKKLKLLLATCALIVGGAGSANAQTDVTNTYITNADFSGNYSAVTATPTKTDNQRDIFQPTGWNISMNSTSQYNLSVVKPGDLQQANFFTGTYVPTDGKYMVRFRQDTTNEYINLSQSITITEAGLYLLSADLISEDRSKLKVELYAGTQTVANYKNDTWQNRSLLLNVSANQNITIGVKFSNNNGSQKRGGADNIKLEKLDNAPVDITKLVVNPTFDDGIDGWTAPSGGAKLANNKTDFTTNFYETWNESPKKGRMYQQITGLPSGTYKLRVFAFADQKGTMSVTNTDVAVYAQGREVGTNDSEHIQRNYVNSTDFTYYDVWAYVDGDGKLEIGMRQDVTTFRWLGMDNVTLEYVSVDNQEEARMLEMYQTKWAAVGGILTDENYTVVTGKERADLSEKLQTTISAYSDYKTAADGANAACLAFMNAKDSYAAYATAKAAASDVTEADVLAVVIAGNSEATAADALAASVILPKAEALKDATAAEPINTDYVVNGSFDSNVDGWTSTGGFQNSQLKDATSGTLDKFWENWNGDAKVNKMYQTINNIPNGTYRLNISAFANTVDGSTQYVFANNDKTNLTDAANPGADYEVYTVVTNNTLEIGLEQTEATANWMGIDNVSLNYFGTGNQIEAAKVAAHKIYWDEALAAAKAAKADAAYQNVKGDELIALNTEIDKNEPSTADGYDAATEALKAATLAFKNAKASYDAFVAAAAEEYTEDTEKYPYASHVKFEAIATAKNVVPTSAEDAVAKTAVIIGAYRQYVESNALAEGVSGAVDMTNLIGDPNFEGVTISGKLAGAWTFDQDGGTVGIKSDESFTDGNGNSNYSYFDYYNGSNNNQNVHQVIKNVAPGRYLLTATGRGHANFNGNLKLYVVDKKSVNIPADGNSGGDFNRGWNDVSLEFELETVSDITIGVQTTNGQAQWWSVTRFRLVQLEVTPLADEGDYTALNSAIGQAESKVLGFAKDEYAPYNNVEALEALATAKQIDPNNDYTKKEVQGWTTAMTTAWTINETDVDIVYNGHFAETAVWNPKGWSRSDNGWGEQVTGLNPSTGAEAGTAWYYNANAAWEYGKAGVYTMPLPANTTYLLTFKYRSQENNTNTGMEASVLKGEDVIASKQFGGNSNKTNFVTAKMVFKTVVAGNYVLSIANTGNTHMTDVSIVKVTSESVTVSEAGYATYVSEYDLDFTDTNIKAYTAKVSSGKVVLTQIEKVPAGTPVVLYCEGGVTEGVPLATSTDTAEDNDLLAGTGAAVATTDGDYTNYILNNVNNEIGFYKANGQKVAANRAYLHVSNSEIPTTARLTIVFEDATGITSLVNSDGVNSEIIYNLNGQRVTTPKRGLYIVGGKKVLKK